MFGQQTNDSAIIGAGKKRITNRGFTMYTRNRCYSAFIFWLGFLFVLTALKVIAAPPAKPAKPSNPPAKLSSQEDQFQQQQAVAWSAFYSGKYEDAVKLCEPLLNAPQERIRVEAGHCQARSYWAFGTEPSEAKARQMWNKLEKVSTLNANQERVKISNALAFAAQDKDAQAISALEDVVRRKYPDTSTAEAAIELAKLYVKVGNFDQAKNVLNFGVSFLERQEKAELSPAAIGPFMKAAKAALNHLVYDRDPGREEFERAEAFRKSKKFHEAIKAYQAITRNFSETNYAHCSEMMIGHCLIGLKQVSQALEHWKKFISVSPSGPWRGQAYVSIIDLYLQETLDLAEAAKWAGLLESSIQTGLSESKSKKSWQACMLDMHLRRGIIAFLKKEHQAAVAAFEQAKKSSAFRTGESGRSNSIAAGLDLLIAAAKAGRSLTPDEVHDPKADSRVALICAMGTMYICIEQYTEAESTFHRVARVEFRLDEKTSAAEMAKTFRGPVGLSASDAQFSYAIFGLGCSQQGQGRTIEARQAFLAAFETYPAGKWHDRTIYELATSIEKKVVSRFYPSATSRSTLVATTRPRTSNQETSGPLGANVRNALHYWMKIIQDYRTSPYRPEALYHAGVLLIDDDRFDEGIKLLTELVNVYPDSVVTGDCLPFMCDILLERREVEQANKYLQTLHGWIKKQQKLNTIPIRKTLDTSPLAEGQEITVTPIGIEHQHISPYPGILLKNPPGLSLAELETFTMERLTFVAMVKGNLQEAKKCVETLPTLADDIRLAKERNLWSEYRRLMFGIENGYLVAYPQELNQYPEELKYLVQLSDFYYVTESFEAADKLLVSLLSNKKPKLTAVQRGYPLYLRARIEYQRKWQDGASAISGFIEAMEEILAENVGTWTEYRAALAIVSYAQQLPSYQKRRAELLTWLVNQKKNELTYTATIILALDCVKQRGDKEACIALLKSIPPSAGKVFTHSRLILEQLESEGSDLNRALKSAAGNKKPK